MNALHLVDFDRHRGGNLQKQKEIEIEIKMSKLAHHSCTRAWEGL